MFVYLYAITLVSFLQPSLVAESVRTYQESTADCRPNLMELHEATYSKFSASHLVMRVVFYAAVFFECVRVEFVCLYCIYNWCVCC